ncbi:MAG: transglycosylase SLT domain-containing protein [Betaproteobacteria bacterium]
MALNPPSLATALGCAAFGVLVAASSAVLAPQSEPQALEACRPEQIAEVEPPSAAAGASAEPAAEPRDPEQERLIRHLSRRFQVAGESIETMVDAAWRAAQRAGLDPLLVLAVISIESRFNPHAESPYGARGLMQIIPRYHRSRIAAQGGESALLDPEANIVVGTQILQEYVRRTGTIEAGLQYYVGSFSDGSAQYAQKVLAERERLEGVMRSKGT